MRSIPKLTLALMSTGFLSACEKPSISTMESYLKKEKDLSIVIDTLWTEKIEESDSYWIEKLTKEQYYITRESGTEQAFSHPYNNYQTVGVYVCVSCENPLFSSETKYKSGTGWPSFWKPYFSRSVNVVHDNSLGMSRDEVVCSRCDAHLGHVFKDGPPPTGLRYCINGIALCFAEKTEKVVFAQGCFWCVEHIFESIKGVKDVVSGYSGGTEENPSYSQVSSGITSHAEAVEVIYNPQEITFEELLKVYFNSGDITQINGQGNDHGKQYRSIVFYKSLEQKQQIENYINKLKLSGDYAKPIAVEVKEFKKFFMAEEYHQNYVLLHLEQGYVKTVSIPRYENAIKKFPELLKN